MTSQPLPDVWATRDFPVLVEVTRRIDAGSDALRVADIAQAVGMTPDDVALAGAALKRRGLVTVLGVAEMAVLRFTDVSAEAYFLTGLHPSGDDAVSNLVEAIRQAADQVDDPAEKSRLRTLADQALNVSREVLAGVMVAVMTRGIGS
jgi:hypothetical protein